MAEEDRWAKLEEIVRRVVREEVQALQKKKTGQIKLVNGRWEGLSQDVLQTLKDAYPAVDVDGQLKEMAAWLVMHPAQAPKNCGAFVQSWLKKHQDRNSIRSIPFPERISTPPNLCEYCLAPSTGSVNGIRHCREHTHDAMDMRPRGKMPGVVPKAVAGAD